MLRAVGLAVAMLVTAMVPGASAAPGPGMPNFAIPGVGGPFLLNNFQWTGLPGKPLSQLSISFTVDPAHARLQQALKGRAYFPTATLVALRVDGRYIQTFKIRDLTLVSGSAYTPRAGQPMQEGVLFVFSGMTGSWTPVPPTASGTGVKHAP